MTNERVERVEVLVAEVPFRRKFAIARGTVGAQSGSGPVVFVKITSTGGAVGWGEQRVVPTWSYETAESVSSTIDGYFAPALIGRNPFDVNAIHRDFDSRITPAVSNGMPFARAALDVALHDLMGHLAGLPVHAFLGGRATEHVDLCWAIGVDTPDAMAEEAEGLPDARSFKVKIAGDPTIDVERIRAVQRVAPSVPIWLDANQSYSVSRATELFEFTANMSGIRSLEQPTASVDWLGLGKIRERSPYPIAIDEGCFSAYDVARIARLDVADQVVLKVCKSGGLRRARESASVARVNGLDLLGSGLTDCGIAFAAAIHLFSTLELSMPAELNGPQYVDDMLLEGLEISDARVRVPDGPGLGIVVDEERIRALAVDA